LQARLQKLGLLNIETDKTYHQQLT